MIDVALSLGGNTGLVHIAVKRLATSIYGQHSLLDSDLDTDHKEKDCDQSKKKQCSSAPRKKVRFASNVMAGSLDGTMSCEPLYLGPKKPLSRSRK